MQDRIAYLTKDTKEQLHGKEDHDCDIYIRLGLHVTPEAVLAILVNEYLIVDG